MASVAQEPGYPLAPGPAKSFDHDTLEQRIRDALALSIAQGQGVTTRDALERLSLSVLLQDVPAAPVTATRRRALLKDRKLRDAEQYVRHVLGAVLGVPADTSSDDSDAEREPGDVARGTEEKAVPLAPPQLPADVPVDATVPYEPTEQRAPSTDREHAPGQPRQAGSAPAQEPASRPPATHGHERGGVTATSPVGSDDGEVPRDSAALPPPVASSRQPPRVVVVRESRPSPGPPGADRAAPNAPVVRVERETPEFRPVLPAEVRRGSPSEPPSTPRSSPAAVVVRGTAGGADRDDRSARVRSPSPGRGEMLFTAASTPGDGSFERGMVGPATQATGGAFEQAGLAAATEVASELARAVGHLRDFARTLAEATGPLAGVARVADQGLPQVAAAHPLSAAAPTPGTAPAVRQGHAGHERFGNRDEATAHGDRSEFAVRDAGPSVPAETAVLSRGHMAGAHPAQGRGGAHPAARAAPSVEDVWEDVPVKVRRKEPLPPELALAVDRTLATVRDVIRDPRGPPPAPWLDANDDAHRDAEEAVAAMLGGYFDYSRARAELHLLAEVTADMAPSRRRQAGAGDGEGADGGNWGEARAVAADPIPGPSASLEDFQRAVRGQVALRIAAAIAEESHRAASAVQHLHAGVPARSPRRRRNEPREAGAAPAKANPAAGGASPAVPESAVSRVQRLAAEHAAAEEARRRKDGLGRAERGVSPAWADGAGAARGARGGVTAPPVPAAGPKVRLSEWASRRSPSAGAAGEPSAPREPSPGRESASGQQRPPRSAPVVAFGSRVGAPLPEPPGAARYQSAPGSKAWLPRVATLQRVRPDHAVFERPAYPTAPVLRDVRTTWSETAQRRRPRPPPKSVVLQLPVTRSTGVQLAPSTPERARPASSPAPGPPSASRATAPAAAAQTDAPARTVPRPRATASQTRAAPAARPPTATDKQRALLQSLLDQVNRRAQDLRAKTDAATSAPGADAASPSASSDAIVDALADAVVARLLESPAGSESREDDGREVGPEDSDVLRQAAVDILSEEALRASTGGSSQGTPADVVAAAVRQSFGVQTDGRAPHTPLLSAAADLFHARPNAALPSANLLLYGVPALPKPLHAKPPPSADVPAARRLDGQGAAGPDEGFLELMAALQGRLESIRRGLAEAPDEVRMPERPDLGLPRTPPSPTPMHSLENLQRAEVSARVGVAPEGDEGVDGTGTACEGASPGPAGRVATGGAAPGPRLLFRERREGSTEAWAAAEDLADPSLRPAGMPRIDTVARADGHKAGVVERGAVRLWAPAADAARDSSDWAGPVLQRLRESRARALLASLSDERSGYITSQEGTGSGSASEGQVSAQVSLERIRRALWEAAPNAATSQAAGGASAGGAMPGAGGVQGVQGVPATVREGRRHSGSESSGIGSLDSSGSGGGDWARVSSIAAPPGDVPGGRGPSDGGEDDPELDAVFERLGLTAAERELVSSMLPLQQDNRLPPSAYFGHRPVVSKGLGSDSGGSRGRQ